MSRIAVIPGDGIGQEIIAEAVKVLSAVSARSSLDLEMVSFDFGAEKYLRTGIALPVEQIEDFRLNYDAILLGPLGDPRIPDMAHARGIVLKLCLELDLYVHYRPIRLLHSRLCPLKDDPARRVNFVLFSDNSEGIYAGLGGVFRKGSGDEIAFQQCLITRQGVERLLRHALNFTRSHGRKNFCLCYRRNSLLPEDDLWARVLQEISEEYAEIEQNIYCVSELVAQLLKNPGQFEVIVASNFFSGVISDLGAQLQGGAGLAAAANLHPSRLSLFQPAHGSLCPQAGQSVANPLGAISSAALLLEHLGFEQESAWINAALRHALETNNTTHDLGGRLGTRQVGDFIAQQISKGAF